MIQLRSSVQPQTISLDDVLVSGEVVVVEIALSMFSYYSCAGDFSPLYLVQHWFVLVELVEHPAVVAVSRWSLGGLCRGAEGKLSKFADCDSSRGSHRGEREGL